VSKQKPQYTNSSAALIPSAFLAEDTPAIRSIKMNLDAVNERLYRLETEVDNVKTDLNEQKVAVARLSEQVTSHEKRGEERHQQLLSTLQEMKTDYRTVLQQQTQHLQEKAAFQNKFLLGILGLLSTIAGGIYGFGPKAEAPQAPVAIPAPVAPSTPETP
jgi:hypothetical protein